jgi:hypothetical protein
VATYSCGTHVWIIFGMACPTVGRRSHQSTSNQSSTNQPSISHQSSVIHQSSANQSAISQPSAISHQSSVISNHQSISHQSIRAWIVADCRLAQSPGGMHRRSTAVEYSHQPSLFHNQFSAVMFRSALVGVLAQVFDRSANTS